MANKLGLCEKSEIMRALCPKSCKACPNDSAGAMQRHQHQHQQKKVALVRKTNRHNLKC